MFLTYICVYHVRVLCIVLFLFQYNRMKGVEEQLKLLFTSGIAAALSTSQNSASVSFAFNSLTAATNQPAIIQSSPTPSITPSVTPTIRLTVTPAVISAITPVTPAVMPAIIPAVTTNQTPVLSNPAAVNASTSGNVVSKSANNQITSMPEIFGFKLIALLFYKTVASLKNYTCMIVYITYVLYVH